jgi:ArsR family transcriptional regulator
MKYKIINAISDPTRLKILINIKKGETCACDSRTCCGVSQPAVSQHLKVLFQAGLVKVRRDGTYRWYSMTKKGLVVLSDMAGW